jgi:molybdopterin-guanine dinucleotide biosynthesis protein A
MGIASAAAAAAHERVFVTACDIPVIDLDTVARMLVLAADYDCVIPMSPVGHEPLFAVYRKSAVPAMHDALEAGERRISAVFPRVRTCFYELGRARWYRNLNTREDVAAFLGAR